MHIRSVSRIIGSSSTISIRQELIVRALWLTMILLDPQSLGSFHPNCNCLMNNGLPGRTGPQPIGRRILLVEHGLTRISQINTSQPSRSQKIHLQETRGVRTRPGTVPQSGTRGLASVPLCGDAPRNPGYISFQAAKNLPVSSTERHSRT